MEIDAVPAPHPLGPDLEVIEAFASASSHDRVEEGRAAMAIYEDVCWRLAMATYTPTQQRDIQRLEQDAADALRAYVQEKLPASEFWMTFQAIMAELDQLTAQLGVQAQDEVEADRALRDWRVRLAGAGLPALLRQQAQTVLELLEDGLVAYHNGKIASSDFWPLFAQGESALEEVLAAEPKVSQEARLHELADQAFALDVPLFLRLPIATHLADQALAWDNGAPIDTGALDELEGLLMRARAFQRVSGPAERHYRRLYEAIGRHALSPAFAEDAQNQFEAIERLFVGLESGQLDPTAFEARFQVAARHVETLLHLHGEVDQDLLEAELCLTDARQQLQEALVPRFVAQTATSIVEVLERLIRDRRSQELDPKAFRAEFDLALKELEVTFEFGGDMRREESESLRRYEALARRVDRSLLAPMLRGPAMDLLETLRGLLHRLDAGLYPLADFRHAFEEVATRLEALLTWQTALAAQVVAPESSTP